MKRLMILLFLLVLAVPAYAQTPVVKFALGANGIWFDEQTYPSDFEAGGNARASLSPHISLVGAAYYGFQNSYTRGSAGVRFTATDADDPNFSVGLGASYHMSNEEAIRPQEWCAEASMGLRPWPNEQPRISLVMLGTYGLETEQGSVLVGARFALGGAQ